MIIIIWCAALHSEHLPKKYQIILFGLLLIVSVHLKPLLDGDTSVMTYRGHSVLHTLIRCHFSPEFTTGQRYVYTGCALGNVIGKQCA